MSEKLNIPEVTGDYKVAIADYLLNLPKEKRDDFYKHLNLISGYCQDADISMSMGNLGGAKSVEQLLWTTSGFEHATIKEFLKFHKEGYSGSDFQHIFLNAFLNVRMEMLLSKE